MAAIYVYSLLSGGSDDDQTVSTTDTTQPADDEPAADEPAADEPDSVTTSTSTTGSTMPPADRVAVPDGECPPLDGTAERKTQFANAQPMCVDESQFYAIDFATTMGDFTMVLDPQLDAQSVNNFVVLAAFHAFDDTIFHRVINGFVVQGGDVQRMDGRGGPGYRFTGGPAEEGWYREGAVAMANSGDASSNGSQFFVITGPSEVSLPPIYSPLGYVTTGYDVVKAIEATETGPGDKPTSDISVTSASVRLATDTEREDFEAAFAS